MPELPEVEISRRCLARWASGRRVVRAIVNDAGAIRGKLSSRPSDAIDDGEARFRDVVEGRTAGEPERAGKRIAWSFGDAGLLVHLGMTGRWVRRSSEQPERARLGLELDDGHTVWFVDARRFGCVVPLGAAELGPTLHAGLGPDAMKAPPTGDELAALLVGGRAVKIALMDQALIAGIGNIQAAEALWRAGIHPATRCRRLDRDAVADLAAILPVQMREFVESQDGDEMVYFSDGDIDNPFSVYKRTGEPCSRCSTPIEQFHQGGRATYFCPSCQPAPLP